MANGVLGRNRYVQGLRGFAICAVVLIHCLPVGWGAVLIRPLLNFCVALFTFMSGMLTSRERVESDVRGFLSERLLKVLVPYLTWSALYLALRGFASPGSVVIVLILGSASAQMYYLIVYVQLVLLTPMLVRASPRSRAIVCAMTPLVLLVRESAAVLGLPLGRFFPPFCGSWLLFYVAGLEWRMGGWPRRIVGSLGADRLTALVTVLLFLQLASGAAWALMGNYDLGTSQLKLVTAFSSLFVALLLVSPGFSLRHLMAGPALVLFGDLSFGVYLSHMLFVPLISSLCGRAGVTEPVSTVFRWVGALLLSCLLGLAFRRWGGVRLRKTFGL